MANATGGLSSDELTMLLSALTAARWEAPLSASAVAQRLSWFDEPELAAWFKEHDGATSTRHVHVLGLDVALDSRKQLVWRDLGPPLSSRDRFLPLIRLDAGPLIYDGGARGLVLRRAREPDAYARFRAHPLPLSILLKARSEPAAAAPEAPSSTRPRQLHLSWLSASPVEVNVSMELEQRQATPAQLELMEQLKRHDGSLRTQLADALYRYYLSVKGLTDYGDPELALEAEPVLDTRDEVWRLVSGPSIWIDLDGGSAPAGFEITWRATFDDEHGVAARIEGWRVVGVGTFMACGPIPHAGG